MIGTKKRWQEDLFGGYFFNCGQVRGWGWLV